MPIINSPSYPSRVADWPPSQDILDWQLEVGRIIWERFIGPGALDYPAGTDLQQQATQWLNGVGFDSVEWAQPKERDDILYLAVSYNDPIRIERTFIIEFAGFDQIPVISTFPMAKSVDY